MKPAIKILIAIFLLQFFVLSTPQTARAAVLSRAPNNLGLVGYWPMNESAGTKAGDSSGNGNTGTLYGSTLPIWDSGKRAGALNFAYNSNSYVEVADSPSLNPGSSSLTVSLWFKMNNAGQADNSILYNKENLFEASAGGGYFTYAWQPHWAWDGGTSFPVNVGEWYHAVVVYDKAKQYVYKNGVEVYRRDQTGDIGTNTNALRIGARNAPSAASNFFIGLTDDVRIYNRALSPTEVSALYQSGSVKLKAPTNQGLVGYWSMNEGAGTKVNDSSGNGNTGTITGAAWTNGKHGNALSFNGSSDYTNVPDATLLNPTNITMSAWVKTTTASRYIIAKDPPPAVTITATATGAGSWTVPAGVTSVQVELWGGGGGGGGVHGGGAGAYVIQTGLSVTPGDSITYVIASGGMGSSGTTKGNGGTGYRSGGNGANGSTTGGGGGGGSSSVVVGGTTYVASGGGQYRQASGSSGGTGDPGSSSMGAGGGGGSGTPGSDGLATTPYTAGAGGTGGTPQTGTNGYDVGYGGGGSSAGASGNGKNCTSNANGAIGSGGAAGGTYSNPGGKGADGSGSNSGGGGGVSSGTGAGGDGGQPGAGGGKPSTSGTRVAGSGGAGELIITYTQDLGKTNVPYALSTTNGGEFLIMNSSTSYTADSSVSVNDGKWHYIAATYDGTTMRIYIDGVQTGTQTGFTGNLPNLAGALHIGADYQATPANFFNGSIDDVRIYNRALSPTEIQNLYGSGQVTYQAPSNQGLVGYWPLNEGVGTKAGDASGNGNSGVMVGSVSWVNGKLGKGVYSLTGRIEINSIPLAGPFTVSYWYKTSINSQTGVIIGEATGNSGGGPKIGIVAGKLFIRLITSSDNTASTPTANLWHHVVLTRGSGDKVDLYVDGGSAQRLFSDAAQTGTYTVNKLMANGSDSSQHYDGNLDDVRIYNRALSATEVLQLYNSK
jgi:hypothetical protein